MLGKELEQILLGRCMLLKEDIHILVMEELELPILKEKEMEHKNQQAERNHNLLEQDSEHNLLWEVKDSVHTLTVQDLVHSLLVLILEMVHTHHNSQDLVLYLEEQD